MSSNLPSTDTNPAADATSGTDAAHGPARLEEAEWLQDLRDDLRRAAARPDPSEPVTHAGWWRRRRRLEEDANRS